MKIAVVGMQHETNTFVTTKTLYQDFAQADNWPELSIGKHLLQNLQQQNIPASGFIAQATKLDHIIIPILWCSAPPSGLVCQIAFDSILKKIINALARTEFDAIYLDLHGAMVTEDIEDADGYLLEQLRLQFGEKIIIAASLDLHANVTTKMFSNADILLAYKTYPHVDMTEIGTAVANKIAYAKTLNKSFLKFDFLITMAAQCTDLQPCQEIYAYICRLERDYSASISFCCGFPLADTKETGPSILTYGKQDTKLITQKLQQFITDKKKYFNINSYTPTQALALIQAKAHTYIFADTEDNPGCGAPGNSTGILEQMLKQNISNAVLGLFYAPENAKLALDKGISADIEFTLGPEKLKLCGTIKNTTNGEFICRGPFYNGCKMQLGPMAVIQIKNLLIVVSSKNVQAADTAMFEHIGINLKTQKIIVVKSSVHFRADFKKISDNILIIKSPGANPIDLADLNYKKLRSGVTSNALTTTAR